MFRDEPGCTYLEGLENDKVSVTDTGTSRKFTIEKGHSCFWLVVSHEKIPVRPGADSLVTYSIEKKDAKKLHAKIAYFDAAGKPMPDAGSDSDGERKASNEIDSFRAPVPDGQIFKRNHVLKTPAGARSARLEFWIRQRQDKSESFEISGFDFKETATLPGLDFVAAYPPSLLGEKDSDP